ncbi:pericentrin-like [Pollicipes pollicipes]|uniref:pericentrin-like n=1 Tax=Pollicipes pollicipes TaxID=41117 RepID=UPI0018852B14|nr:pericentrin-like [Pollicipes pollicipes]
MVAECNREVDDIKQQMAAADKQLRAGRAFLDELTAEREAERDEFGREQARLVQLVAERERERDEQAIRRRQLESVEVQNSELLSAAQESEHERAGLRDELKAAVDKIYDLRDIIRSLESHLDELGQSGEQAGLDRLRAELLRLTAANGQLQKQLASCSCSAAARPGQPSAAGAAPPPTAALNTTAESDDTTLSVCPSLLQELRDQLQLTADCAADILIVSQKILQMGTHVEERVETLENSFCSAVESLSPAGSQRDLTRAPTGDELGRLRRQLDRLVSVEEAALARTRQLEAELSRCRAGQQDLLVEREVLQKQLTEQLLQQSALRARLQQSRLAAEVGTEPETEWRGRLAYLQAELDAAAKLMRAKEKQLADLTCQLDETRRKLIARESELARLGRDQERAPPAGSPREAAELRSLQARHRALQLQYQELLAQLRENNLPEFVERLLSDKNQQIEDLERNVRGLAQQSSRSLSAGDRSGQETSLSARLLAGLSGSQPSPEVLRHAAASSAHEEPSDLSRLDVSALAEKTEERSPQPPSARAMSPPASEHSWDSAPTVPGSEAGGASASAGSEQANSAFTSSSGDSIQQLKATLRRKKQLLSTRKQELEGRGRSETSLPAADQSADSQEETVRLQRQLEQLRGRLEVLNPILARLDQDYSSVADSMDGQKVATSETELRLLNEVSEIRQAIGKQEAAHCQLEQQIQQLRQQGAETSSPQMRCLEEQLLVTLRDMEINKLDACSKMHEASALMARAQRQSQQEKERAATDGGSEPDPTSSGYMSELAASSPAYPAAPASARAGYQQEADSVSESEAESAFVSGTERSEPAYSEVGSKSSCPSLLDEVAGLADIDEEVERLRARIGDLERELGHRGDAPSAAGPGPWRDRLEAERSAWSQERQRLQQRIARLDAEQERLRRGQPRAGDGDDARLQYAYGRFLRAESYRRALCWQKRYLMVLLGGYQETETMTLQRMTQLTGGAFWPDGRRFLAPLAKFRAAAWVLIAVHRMAFMVHRWRAGRRSAGALTAPADRAASPADRAASPVSSCLSASTAGARAQLDQLDRIVRDCSASVPDLSQFDARSVTSVSDVCTEDLEPYLARFDALLDRQGLPPQPGGAR